MWDLYKVVGRRVIQGGRLKEFEVFFKTKWRRGAKRMYLVGNFTSWFPGFKRLAKTGEEGHARLYLYPGTYAYWFQADNTPTPILDEENERTAVLPNIMHPEKPGIKGSLLDLAVPDDPFEYVIHDEKDPAYLHRFSGYVVFRLRTGKRVEAAWLHIEGGDKGPTAVHDLPLERVFEFVVPEERLGESFSYHFQVCAEGVCLEYGFNGVGRGVRPIKTRRRELPGLDKPKWFMGTVYYQIFVDSFYNGDPSNDPPVKIRRLAPREHGYYGGDLKGVLAKVDHLVRLGVEAVYLTPIYPAGTYHRYDVRDYLSVDKYLGDISVFNELVRELEKRGLKLVLDITLHHTGACHPFFVDALEHGRASRYWEWYNFLDDPSKYVDQGVVRMLRDCDVTALREYLRRRALTTPFYESFFSNWLMPKINHENPETLDYFVGVAKAWMERGVAGFRVDVAHGIKEEWLGSYYRRVKELSDDFLVLGEICDYPFLYREYMDSYMNYWLRYWLVSSIALKKTGLRQAVEMINLQIANHPYPQLLSLYNLLGSHDTPRVKTLVKGDKRLLKLLIALNFTLPGSPAVYYGDEVGLEGGDDPDNRRPMPWDSKDWDLEVYEAYRTFIDLHKKLEELRHGFASVRLCRDDVIVVERWLKGRVVGLFNAGSEPVEASLCTATEGLREVVSSEPGPAIGSLGFKIFASP
ncbi:alpha-amylase family glycosyl hydrolase [Thermogladius calderae]|uniref:alpha-amylase family glycosyl hydrolase n=1 Tax=Thermogladius calderae TaxID=1200300 RepID=UPI003B84AA7A